MLVDQTAANNTQARDVLLLSLWAVITARRDHNHLLLFARQAIVRGRACIFDLSRRTLPCSTKLSVPQSMVSMQTSSRLRSTFRALRLTRTISTPSACRMPQFEKVESESERL